MNKILLFSSLKKPKDVIDLAISSWIALTNDNNTLVDVLVMTIIMMNLAQDLFRI